MMMTISNYNDAIAEKNEKLFNIRMKSTRNIMIGTTILEFILIICDWISFYGLVFISVIMAIVVMGFMIVTTKMEEENIDKNILTQCSKFTNIALDAININEYNRVNSVDIIINNEVIKIYKTDILSTPEDKIPMNSFIFTQKYRGNDYIAYFAPGHDFYELKEKVEKDVYNPNI